MEITHLLEQIKNRQPQLMGADHYQYYGVLMPLVEVNQETHVLFEVRSMQLRSQPGDICFPGGRMDQTDASPMLCALRETVEEIGIHEKQLEHIAPLDYMITGSKIIYPFVGKLTSMADIQLNQAEVEEVFTVPLDFFIHHSPRVHKVYLEVQPEEDFPYDLIQNGKSYDWRKRAMNEFFYQYEDYVIWGLTAKIMHHFVQLMK